MIFSGASNDKAKAFAMENYGCSLVSFMDLFAVAPEPEPSTSSTTLSSSMKAASCSQSRKPKRSGQSPYERPSLTTKVE
uniref:Uncharacterized protein n=1 Tax=Moniliophthora roreri TaxID=221103 RepID=A0A0W0FN91_MONRR